MTFATWAIILGALLIAMVLSGTLLKRLPLCTAMLYLAAGFTLGPGGWGVLTLNPLNHAAFLERATEVAVLVSLFSVGLKLGLPLSNRHWVLPLRLAFVSMTLTVALISVTGVLLLDLPLGAAILLGAILAPTDPVLASAVQVESSGDRDHLRFSLTGEGGLNDGTAFPFVMLGLGLLGRQIFGGRVNMLYNNAALLFVLALFGGLVLLALRMTEREHRTPPPMFVVSLHAVMAMTALLLLVVGYTHP